MNISILISSKDHPINPFISEWIEKNSKHNINVINSKKHLTSGDILFLISCSEIISKIDRDKYKKTLVIHASDLPHGRGWSPHIWEIISGATNITLSLLEAEDEIDAGNIWKKVDIPVSKTALYYEINDLIFHSEIKLMDFAIENFNSVEPKKQNETNISYWPKRSPDDSLIDINQTIYNQFNLLRVSDPKRYPAYFFIDDVKFNIMIQKSNE